MNAVLKAACQRNYKIHNQFVQQIFFMTCDRVEIDVFEVRDSFVMQSVPIAAYNGSRDDESGLISRTLCCTPQIAETHYCVSYDLPTR